MKLRKFKCLPNIKVSEIIDYSGLYNKIKVPKGCRLINIQEIITLLESNEENKFLGKYKNIYNYFWIKQRKYDKKNNNACRVYRSVDGYWGANWGRFDYSYSYGRVVFVEENK